MNLNDKASGGKRVAVIGGGISGLSAAHRLTELDPALDITLLEAGERLGGVLQTERRDGFCIELGPDSIFTQLPWGLDLCRRIGFADELISTNDAHRQTYVVRDGRLHRLPEGLAVMAPSRIWPILATPILSLRGKLRLGWEYFVPTRRDSGDESLAAFARRRLGREMFERLVQPLVSGIYMADAEKLSMRAAMPLFFEMESKHGSLVRAVRRAAARKRAENRAAAGPRYSMFVAPREGLGSLVAAVAARLPAGTVHLNCPVTSVTKRSDGGWTLSLSRSAAPAPASRDFDRLIIATAAHQAARLLSAADNVLADQLQAIRHAGCVIVVAAYARDQVAHPLDGFGFVVPQVEHRDVLACTFSSVKYTGRAPEGSVLFRVFLGGACREDLMEKSDDAFRQIVSRELGELLGVHGEPTLCRISRWPNVMPQYEIGHLDQVQQIEDRLKNLENLQLAGNALGGVGIPHCIHSGEQAAEHIVRHIGDLKQ